MKSAGEKQATSNPVHSSSGVILDVNGDGYADFLVASQGGTAHLYLGAASPTGAAWNTDPHAGRIDIPHLDETSLEAAAVALARKLAGILFAMWRDGTTYQSKRSAEVAKLS